MRHMMRTELEHIHERLDRVEEGSQQRQQPKRDRLHRREVEEVDEAEGEGVEEEFDRMLVDSHRQYGRDRK
ncbi:hypothetical protein PanWU01x14_180270, partial [Parasponia andersonii]